MTETEDILREDADLSPAASPGIEAETRDGEIAEIPDTEGETPPDVPDYEARIEEELEALRRAVPEMRDARSITELESPIRYAELRDLGLSPKEAYLATSGRRRQPDNRRHLFSAVPVGSGAPSTGMTRSELESARELFPGLGDSELMGLYKKVRA